MSEAAHPPAPMAALDPAVGTPPRIKSLTLCDFRAFAGPEPVTFTLDGKNLLIYGENGAGKSSVFHALDEFFSVARRGPQARKERLLELKNVFSRQPDARLKISVEFDDGKPAAQWTTHRHPVDIAPTADDRVKNAAYRKAILDYRSLLETNYRHGDGTVNLFDVCVNVLLRDYPVLHSGQEFSLFDLWTKLTTLLDVKARGQNARLRQNDKTEALLLMSSINQGIRYAITSIISKINLLLQCLGWNDIVIDYFLFPGLTYINNTKIPASQRISGTEIGIELRFLNNNIQKPQFFLNEARLSALALAIYFAGRQVCAGTLQSDTPRLIVLDDVLIGLDQSNRMPVLRMLEQHFSAWQIVLLTHDRVWYEMARFHLADQTRWTTVEMFEEKQPDGAPRPILRPSNVDAIAANIATARRFHGVHEYSAAAVHARVAFELAVKKLCERKLVPVRFKSDPRQLSSDELLTAIETWLGDPSRTAVKGLVDPAIVSLKLWRKVVLNPFSHSTPVSLSASEVVGAIDAVEKLHADFQAHIPG